MNNLSHYLQKLFMNQTLTRDEARQAVDAMLEQSASEQIAAFVSLLKYRGETLPEIVGMLEALYRRSETVVTPYPVFDIVGTGGDNANTVNISTGSAILLAACGVPVVKHGNRSVSSQCGSADVLEALGVDINMSADKVIECLKTLNIAFLFAPKYHSALAKLKPTRQALSIPTIFNYLGPLLNPAKAEYALIGVADVKKLEMMADAVLELGYIKSALVYHGCGLDELTTLGNAVAFEIRDGKKLKIEIDPQKIGFRQCSLEELRGSDAVTNAGLLRNALSGVAGAITDTLLLNAGAALKVYGKVSSIVEGVEYAAEVMHAGKAMELLERWMFASEPRASASGYKKII